MHLGSDPIARLSALFSECTSRRDYEAVRLEWLGHAVGFDASYFGAASPEQRVTPVVSGVNTRRVEHCEAHADRYWRDRLLLQRAALSQGGAFADHATLSLRERDRMPFYREVVAGHGIRATAVGVLRLRGQVSGCVFLGRSSRGARFGRELALFRQALPVLSLANAVHEETETPILTESSELTPRERTVLALLCRGCTNLQIAAHLGTSTSTVKNQVSAILRKTHAENRTELAARFVRKTPPA